MATKDRTVLKKVVNDWMSAMGCSVSVTTVIDMLARLETTYGDDFSVEKACDALDKVASDARAIEQDLRKRMEQS